MTVVKIEDWMERFLGRKLTEEERAYGRQKLGGKCPDK
jgi:hypothetical protein